MGKCSSFSFFPLGMCRSSNPDWLTTLHSLCGGHYNTERLWEVRNSSKLSPKPLTLGRVTRAYQKNCLPLENSSNNIQLGFLGEKAIQAGCGLIAYKVKNVAWLRGNRQPRLSWAELTGGLKRQGGSAEEWKPRKERRVHERGKKIWEKEGKKWQKGSRAGEEKGH